MNNYQWLLHMDGAERQAWFDAEHVETPNATLHGDTAALDAKNKRVTFAERIRFVDEIERLTAERDEARREREHYRKKFGKCLDYADAIHALMDEGLA